MKFEFNEEKNIWLKETRGVSFDDIIKAIKNDQVVDDIGNQSKKYKHQRLLLVNVKKYIYTVPYVIKSKGVLFLKTIYPSRVLTKKYLIK